jgi:hypothetical protein
MTTELAIVVTREAVGAPGLALPVPVAPIAPEPPDPAVLTPLKLMMVMEAPTLWDKVAVAVTLLSVVVANARQISELPVWTFVRVTSVQVNPVLAMLLTDVLVPLPEASVEMNARTSSFAAVVENEGDAIVLALDPRSVDLVTSTEMGGAEIFVRL